MCTLAFSSLQAISPSRNVSTLLILLLPWDWRVIMLFLLFIYVYHFLSTSCPSSSWCASTHTPDHILTNRPRHFCTAQNSPGHKETDGHFSVYPFCTRLKCICQSLWCLNAHRIELLLCNLFSINWKEPFKLPAFKFKKLKNIVSHF